MTTSNQNDSMFNTYINTFNLEPLPLPWNENTFDFGLPSPLPWESSQRIVQQDEKTSLAVTTPPTTPKRTSREIVCPDAPKRQRKLSLDPTVPYSMIQRETEKLAWDSIVRHLNIQSINVAVKVLEDVEEKNWYWKKRDEIKRLASFIRSVSLTDEYKCVEVATYQRGQLGLRPNTDYPTFNDLLEAIRTYYFDNCWYLTHPKEKWCLTWSDDISELIWIILGPRPAVPVTLLTTALMRIFKDPTKHAFINILRPEPLYLLFDYLFVTQTQIRELEDEKALLKQIAIVKEQLHTKSGMVETAHRRPISAHVILNPEVMNEYDLLAEAIRVAKYYYHGCDENSA